MNKILLLVYLLSHLSYGEITECYGNSVKFDYSLDNTNKM
jgi:hypothetical protein